MEVFRYFYPQELQCKCGCGLLPPAKSVERLYALRILYGNPIILTSAARCAEHNRKVGGAASSTHLPDKDRNGALKGLGGCGFDIRTTSTQQAGEIERLALACGFRGIGRGKGFVHIDDADRAIITFWDY